MPVTVIDSEIVVIGRYPTNEEIVKLLDVPMRFVGAQPKVVKVRKKRSDGCGCSGGDCSLQSMYSICVYAHVNIQTSV